MKNLNYFFLTALFFHGKLKRGCEIFLIHKLLIHKSMRFLPGHLFYWSALLIFIFAPFAHQSEAQNQRETTVSETSYREARRVLEAAITAYGGREALRTIENFSVKFEGDNIHRNQSRRADPPYDRTPLRGLLVVDVKNGRLSQELWRTSPGGFDGHTKLLVDGKQGAVLNLLEKRITKLDNPSFSNFRDRLRWLPHNILLDAASRGISLRSLGKAVFNNRPHDVITYSTEDGQQLTFYIDSQTNLMSKFETVSFDIIVNESAAETIFPDYRTIEGKFKIPTRRILKRGGEETENLPYTEVKLNQTYAAEFFSPPSTGFTPAVPGPANEPPVTKLSPNVYLVRAANGYNSMFVVFPTYVLVLEAPINDLTSRGVIARIKETVPDKPIKYVAVTHHHTDHSGGVREYVRAGANIVTTPGNRGFFRRMVEDVFASSLSGNPPIARREFIETFQKKRVFSEGGQTVELYDIGAGPHAEEMTVAYFPNEKIIFQGDLLNLPDDGRLAGANATTKHFAEWLEKSKLAVDKIAAVHGPPATLEQMRQAIRNIPQFEGGACFDDLQI